MCIAKIKTVLLPQVNRILTLMIVFECLFFLQKFCIYYERICFLKFQFLLIPCNYFGAIFQGAIIIKPLNIDHCKHYIGKCGFTSCPRLRGRIMCD